MKKDSSTFRIALKLSLFFLLSFLLFNSCSQKTTLKLESTNPRKLKNLVASSSVFQKGNTGFALYDLEKQKWIYQYQSNDLFTPASNTKILTLHHCLKSLSDSTIAFISEAKGDTLILWGSGDPTFLHSSFTQNQKLFDQLLDSNLTIVLAEPHFDVNRFGEGWCWDDYNSKYQREISSLPLFGNLVTFSTDSATVKILPTYFENYSEVLIDKSEDCKVQRDEFSNSYTISLNTDCIEKFKQKVPFTAYSYLWKELLEDTLKKAVGIRYDISPPPSAIRQVGVPLDTVYRKMMRESDNFLAEQLLLQSSLQNTNILSADEALKAARKNLKPFMVDSIYWADGSGMSRYNQLSPRVTIAVLNEIYQLTSIEFVKDVFAAGGVNGTLKNHYYDPLGPYVFAKTGTLRNVHCLSGYILTDKGTILSFSFMHNDYSGSSAPYKEEMEQILRYIKKRY